MIDRKTGTFREDGARQLIMQALNESCNGYEGETIQFVGLMKIVATHTQEVETINSEDVQGFMIIKGPLLAAIEITMTGVSPLDLAVLTGATVKSTGEIGDGNTLNNVKRFGIAWLKSNGTFKRQYNNVYFDQPDDKSISKGLNGSENDLVLKAHGFPVMYNKNGELEPETQHINRMGDSNWDLVKDSINFPTE